MNRKRNAGHLLTKHDQAAARAAAQAAGSSSGTWPMVIDLHGAKPRGWYQRD